MIRPVKGLEPYLYECLTSTFKQSYPKSRFTVYLCVADRNDPALPTLEKVLKDFSGADAKIFIEDEDPNLLAEAGRSDNLGPNPKIRNMSRAYKEAKGDLVWIVDCNVWVGPRVADQMVDRLAGLGGTDGKKYKFVHQLPLSINLAPRNDAISIQEWILEAGGLLEETFLSTSHAKFYTAINTVAIAPCIVGKSNMFRRSHLDALTSSPSATNPGPDPPRGIDHFSYNICEDHLIGDLLWKSEVPLSVRQASQLEGVRGEVAPTAINRSWGNHAMLKPISPDNLAIQPMVHYPLRTYIDRRVRWLRVRKFTVFVATLVEPGTESFLCSAYGAFGLTSLPWSHHTLNIPPTWTAFAVIWSISILCWALIDRWVWSMLHPPGVADEFSSGGSQPRRRTFGKWVCGWLGREMLALPIWCWAFYFGGEVVWRGTKFSVSANQRVRRIDDDQRRSQPIRLSSSDSSGGDTGSGGESGHKRRRD